MSKYTCKYDGCNQVNYSKTMLCAEHREPVMSNEREEKRLRTSEKNTWRLMIYRCTNPKARGYKYYGGRGITICDEWLNSYEKFIEHIGPKPNFGFSIDRINNDGNYEPGNVRWATGLEQYLNSNAFGRKK